MKLWRFLKYERSYMLLCAATFGLVMLIGYTEPGNRLHAENLIYLLVLQLLLMAAFFGYRYYRNTLAIRMMREEDGEPLSLEAEACQQVIQEMERAHIRALNEVHARQKEYYDFIVSWFHEVKTPISVIRLMQQTEVDARSLEEQVTRIEQYVDQALYYAKLDSFNQDYELVNCDLEPLVKAAVKSSSKAFIAKKIRLSLDIGSTIVQSDSKWLYYIIGQLLSNGLKYTPAQGEISIAARTNDREKLLIVRDTGIGIEPRDLPRIFNRGFTGTNGRIHMKSTGMGLYLAQELSKRLGHYITCVSEAGRFTEMTVHFPRSHDPYRETLQHAPFGSDGSSNERSSPGD
ncbi:HAMP domain-containing histidine kinase [Paenibacillus rhizovicinus]|uniref:histidine kinase n=1 Tax=Paenibacillus rhizovicinus TaxID=2704463 RepID=A0A6C0PBQ4_9BACL|nr:sensor histidine kinase [Paenibacillus rhizovicinus]QHW34052.1 HAMP domain-containing histidine kinase [Paenibacillus rhizovicinus]